MPCVWDIVHNSNSANPVLTTKAEFAYEVYTETLYHRDDALLHIAYVMLIWAVPIPADR